MHLHKLIHFIYYCGFSADYSACGASTGQTLAQLPQSMHTSASITYLPSPSLMQETGHSAAQAPQLMQSSLIHLPHLLEIISKEEYLPLKTILFYHTIRKKEIVYFDFLKIFSNLNCTIDFFPSVLYFPILLIQKVSGRPDKFLA